jgi:hypothetical protein
MPVPNIIVFNTKWANDIITEFEALGFGPYYNNKVNNYQWFIDNMPDGKHRLYWLYEDGLYDGVCSDLDGPNIIPAFCIVFTNVVDEDVWAGIKKWLAIEVFSFGVDGMFKTDEHLKIEEFMTRPCSEKGYYEPEGVDIVYEGQKGKCLSTEPEEVKAEYEFRCKYIAECDTKFYEVVRTNTKLPFTVVVYNFKKACKDDAWFFTDIYGSSDWDYNRIECRYDFAFLAALWKSMDLGGEFTIDLVKRRVDSCYIDRIEPGTLPQLEPVVYRRNMDDVIDARLKRKSIEDLPDFIKRNKV